MRKRRRDQRFATAVSVVSCILILVILFLLCGQTLAAKQVDAEPPVVVSVAEEPIAIETESDIPVTVAAISAVPGPGIKEIVDETLNAIAESELEVSSEQQEAVISVAEDASVLETAEPVVETIAEIKSEDVISEPAAEITEEPVVEETVESIVEDVAEAAVGLISLGTYTITGYCTCVKCCGRQPGDPGYGITATGTRATAGRTIAVDPKVIPYGTHVFIDGHEYIAEDCGSGVNGNHIDMCFATHEEALAWGKQTREVFVQP